MKKVLNITVAIPTLDRPEALSRCLEGLYAGSVLPAEVLIIDQGQNLTAEPVIKHFQSQSTPIIHCRQPRKGLSAARNLASAHASCPIIAFTDDDCVPDSDWLSCIDRTITAYPTIDGVTGSILPLGPESPEQFAVSVRNRNKGAEFRGRALPWKVGSGGNFAVKRDWLNRIGGYDERLGAGSPGQAAEDMDVFYRLLQSGAVFRYEPKAVIYHERQDRARLLRSFWSYSYGLGAFCAKHLRRGDLYAGYILGVWAFWLSWRTSSFLFDRKGPHTGEGLLSLKGCTHGLAYGFKLR
jgi:GT2 family glycosyltransferase